jgi:hypothetical protein
MQYREEVPYFIRIGKSEFKGFKCWGIVHSNVAQVMLQVKEWNKRAIGDATSLTGAS